MNGVFTFGGKKNMFLLHKVHNERWGGITILHVGFRCIFLVLYFFFFEKESESWRSMDLVDDILLSVWPCPLPLLFL